MLMYQVEINGRNFLLDVEGQVAKHGFFTICFVEAEDPAAAENTAIRIIRETQKLRDLMRNASNDPPVMDVTQIIEVGSFNQIENPEPGFVWYVENPKLWWQFWK
jgi:acetolactate synthase regulatory subunit